MISHRFVFAIFLVVMISQMQAPPVDEPNTRTLTKGIIPKSRSEGKIRSKTNRRNIDTPSLRGYMEFESNNDDFIFFDDETLASSIICENNRATFTLVDTEEQLLDYLGDLPVNVLIAPTFEECVTTQDGDEVLSYYTITGIRKGLSNNGIVVATAIRKNTRKSLSITLNLETKPVPVLTKRQLVAGSSEIDKSFNFESSGTTFKGGLRDTYIRVKAGFSVNVVITISNPIEITYSNYYESSTGATIYLSGSASTEFDLLSRKTAFEIGIPNCTFDFLGLVSGGVYFDLQYEIKAKIEGTVELSYTIGSDQPRVLREVFWKDGQGSKVTRDENPQAIVTKSIGGKATVESVITPSLIPRIKGQIVVFSNKVLETGIGMNNKFPLSLKASIAITDGSILDQCLLSISLGYELSIFAFLNNDQTPDRILATAILASECLLKYSTTIIDGINWPVFPSNLYGNIIREARLNDIRLVLANDNIYSSNKGSAWIRILNGMNYVMASGKSIIVRNNNGIWGRLILSPETYTASTGNWIAFQGTFTAINPQPTNNPIGTVLKTVKDGAITYSRTNNDGSIYATIADGIWFMLLNGMKDFTVSNGTIQVTNNVDSRYTTYISSINFTEAVANWISFQNKFKPMI